MEKTFSYQNTPVFYQTTGSGKTMVFLHGFGEDSRIFDNQVEFLKDKCRVIVFDIPGSGKSPVLQGANTTDDYALVVHALLLHENITSCIMLGHSMGGYITLAFAERYPEMLAGFGFVHSTAFADSDEKKESRKKGIEMIKRYGSYPFLKNTISNLFSDNYKQTHAREVAALIEKGKDFTPDALEQYYTAMMNRPDRTSVLRNSNVPVLFIAGTEDVAAPLNDVLQQVHLPEVSYIHILEGVGHMGMLETPDEVNKYISAYINAVAE